MFQQAADWIGLESRKSLWGQFWSAHQRFFKYLCIAAKVRRLVELAREELAHDKVSKPSDLEQVVGGLKEWMPTVSAGHPCPRGPSCARFFCPPEGSGALEMPGVLPGRHPAPGFYHKSCSSQTGCPLAGTPRLWLQGGRIQKSANLPFVTV